MAITERSRKMLWGRSAAICAFPDCPRCLIAEATPDDPDAVIGQECHIVAQAAGGPRADAGYDAAQLDDYTNLILLCRDHHGLVDAQPNTYTVETLQEYKRAHEAGVRDRLDFAAQQDDETYGGIVDRWAELADLANWDSWTSFLMAGAQPILYADRAEALAKLNHYLFLRVWPGRYSDLEDSLENFRRVVNDFLPLFQSHAIRHGDFLRTEKFYQIDRWDEELYGRRHDEYLLHVYLVEDLVCELTRAANLVCDLIRVRLNRAYRRDEGALSVVSGPDMMLRYVGHRTEYSADERTASPYPGLEAFRSIRTTRDLHFGAGTSVEDAVFREWKDEA